MKSPILLTLSRVPVADVVVRDRLRPVGEAGVASLLASIAETGVMKDAIHVRKKKDGKLYLIAGGHRLEAARQLGWQDIEAKVWTDVTDDWARLMEIDDNLAGAEMDALDTAVFLARRKEVYERLHPETKRGVAGGLARHGLASDIMSFAESTAKKFSITKRHVERMIAAGAKLGPDETRRLRSAPRPITLADLQAIAKIGETGERYAVVDALCEGKAKSAAEARKAFKVRESGVQPTLKDPVEDQFKALMTVWNRSGAAARARFLSAIGEDDAA